MRSSFVVPGILLVLFFAGCKSESRVDESTAGETVATVAPTATIAKPGTVQPIPEAQPQVEATTTTEAITATEPPAQPAPKPATQPPPKTTTRPAAQPVSVPASPAMQPATPPTAAPSTATTAPAPALSERASARTPSAKVPKNHTVNKEGALHAPGLENPTQRCIGCHGRDLKGGKLAPSCYQCHEKVKW